MTRNSLSIGSAKFEPRKAITILKERRKEFFWAWIAYQTIKGTVTTSLIWAPALALWFST